MLEGSRMKQSGSERLDPGTTRTLSRAQSQLNEIPGSQTLLAFVLEGVPTKWQMDVLQFVAVPTTIQVYLEGCGTIQPVAYQLSQEQARHLATQITELLGPEKI